MTGIYLGHPRELVELAVAATSSQQQLSFALIRARIEEVRASDELGMHQLAKWALIYEKRAHWMTKNRQLAYSLPSIDWKAVRL